MTADQKYSTRPSLSAQMWQYKKLKGIKSNTLYNSLHI